MTNAAPAIEIRGLEKHFPTFALGPLDLTVPRGSIYGLIGPNGAGKTTTIDLIFGMGAKRAGSITVLGLDHLRDEAAMKSQVAYVSPDLRYSMTGKIDKAIAFVRAFRPTWDDAYSARLMEVFGLRRSDSVAQLSFGSRIKLGVLIALSWRPKVLILDEPTVGLDAIAKRDVFAELLAAVRDEDRSVLISSHGLSDLERFADHVGMIQKGRMVVEGPTNEVTERFRMVDLQDPADPSRMPGVVVQSHVGDRWRVLLDLTRFSIEAVGASGARVLSDGPVSLEELFLALAKR